MRQWNLTSQPRIPPHDTLQLACFRWLFPIYPESLSVSYSPLPGLLFPSWLSSSAPPGNRWLSAFRLCSRPRTGDSPPRFLLSCRAAPPRLNHLQPFFFHILFRVDIFVKYKFKHFFCHRIIDGSRFCQSYQLRQVFR